jgi:hypothetical protein
MFISQIPILQQLPVLVIPLVRTAVLSVHEKAEAIQANESLEMLQNIDIIQLQTLQKS